MSVISKLRRNGTVIVKNHVKSQTYQYFSKEDAIFID